MKDFKKSKPKGNKNTSKNKGKPNLKRKISETEPAVTNGEIKHQTKKKKLFIPKEHEHNEINNLKDVEILHHSNIFRLQIQEIIIETSHSTKVENTINNWIESFNEWTKTLKTSKQYNIYDLSWLEKLKIVYPLIKFPTENTKMEPFLFIPPDLIKIVGSYKNRTSLYPIFNVDLLIEIPKKSMLASDWKNGRYFIKRTLYLCYFAHLLKKNKSIKRVEFSFRDNDPLKIYLLITPVWDSETPLDIKICLDVAPPSEHYKLERFLPNKNNIRSEWLINESFTCSSPSYNGSFLMDLTAMKNNDMILENFISHKSLQEAVKLLKIWLKQRNLDQGPGGVTGYLISMYIICLNKLNKITPAMSSYQIMRSSLVNLVASDWCKQGLMFEPNNSKHQENLKLMHQYYEVVFLDPSGYANLCHQMSKNLFKRLKLEAENAIKLMDSISSTCFQDLFIDKISEYLYFDEIIKIQSCDKLKDSLKETGSEIKQLEGVWYSYNLSQSMVLDLLQYAIGERCVLICPINKSSNTWPVNQSNPKKERSLSIGILLKNFSTAFNVMTAGPAPGDPKVELFKKLWGDKVELRRFKDGTICETVLWTDNAKVSTYIKRKIVQQIVAYIFKMQLKLNEKDYLHLNCDLMEILNQPWLERQTTGEEPLREVVERFDTLSRDIISLKDLPISISSVLSLSASLRYTEAIPIEYANGYDLKWLKRNIESNNTLPYIRYVHPHEGIINLEKSNKWPNNFDAVQRIKKGFQLEISRAIKSQLNLQVRNHVDFFDVYKDGFVYRMRVAYFREPYLLRTRNLPDGKTIHESCPEADDLERENEHLPQISTALRGIQRFNAFGPSARLAKRWLRSQFLDDYHFPDILIDMLVAYLFLAPGSFHVPQQPQVAFLRFLQLLSKTDLTLKPIIIDFNQEMTSEDITQADTLCSSRKRLAQGPPLFIATPWDLSGEIWTKNSPTAPVLLRVRGLAQRAYQLLIKNVSNGHRFNYKNIFRHDTTSYDVVLELDTNIIRSLAPDVDMKWEDCMNTNQKPGKKMPIVGANPIADYMQNLRDHFGELALFFYNPYNSKQIGIIFNKKTKEMMETAKEDPINENKQEHSIFNVELLLEDILEMGKDLVSSSINNYSK